MFGFDRLQLLHQRVVFRIGDLGVIEHVVAVRVMVDHIAQLASAARGTRHQIRTCWTA